MFYRGVVQDEGKKEVVKTLFFFSHRSHNDIFNGTSVYDGELLRMLESEFKLNFVEPDFGSKDRNRTSDLNFKSLVSLLFRVYIKQLKWYFINLKCRDHRKTEKMMMLVEDIYSSPIPLIISIVFDVKFIYRAADFGKAYYNTLSIKNKIFKLFYPLTRRVLEHFVIKKATIIICPSQRTREDIILKYDNLESKVIVLPYVKKEKKVNVEMKSVKDAVSKVNVVLLGDYRYPPNHLAAKFVLDNVVDKLKSDEESFNLYVVGPTSDLLLKSSHKSVKILGPLKDLDDILLRSHIGLAPTTTVGGLSMKIVDYLVNGLRVIATQEASAGIVPNSQLKVVPLKDFSQAIDAEISDLLQNGFNRYISLEVIEEYMSDKWEKNLVAKLKKV